MMTDPLAIILPPPVVAHDPGPPLADHPLLVALRHLAALRCLAHYLHLLTSKYLSPSWFANHARLPSQQTFLLESCLADKPFSSCMFSGMAFAHFAHRLVTKIDAPMCAVQQHTVHLNTSLFKTLVDIVSYSYSPMLYWVTWIFDAVVLE